MVDYSQKMVRAGDVVQAEPISNGSESLKY